MRTTHKQNLIAAALVGALAMSGLATQALAQETRFDKLANLPFTENRPTKETAQILRDELLFQRATQTYLWALPLINTLGMKKGSEGLFRVSLGHQQRVHLPAFVLSGPEEPDAGRCAG